MDSTKAPVVTASDCQQMNDSANNVWKPICVKFNLCDIRYIENYNFLHWDQDSMEAEFIAINYEPRTINIIIVEDIKRPVGVSGYATLSGIAQRGRPLIVLSKTLPWIHELGHYFGLEHTFAGILGLANGSDCATTGDLICDTEPDPCPNPAHNVHYDRNQCKYIWSQKDANNEFYNPLLENYMSYYSGCTKSFTHQQYEKMISTYKIDIEAHF